MGYSRSYDRTVSRTVNVSYPKSESGGSKSVTVDIPVHIEIDVDTQPFDHSIGSAINNIDLLTGSVVATETAQIASIHENSSNVSETIINGFFGLIKSEINQQITEYRPKVDVLIIQLMKQKEEALSKKNQMSGDYARISDRYLKIFNDLDKETRNRIKALCASVFDMQSQIDKQISKSTSEVIPSIASSGSKEGVNVQTIISASNIKHKALELIDQAKQFILSERRLSNSLRSILIPSYVDSNSKKYIPIIFLEKNNKTSVVENSVCCPAPFKTLNNQSFIDKITNVFVKETSSWKPIPKKSVDNIDSFFQSELQKLGDSNIRLSKQIVKLWDNNKENILQK